MLTRVCWQLCVVCCVFMQACLRVVQSSVSSAIEMRYEYPFHSSMKVPENTPEKRARLGLLAENTAQGS